MCSIHGQMVCSPVNRVSILYDRAAAGQADACEVFAELNGLLTIGVCGLGGTSAIKLTVDEDDNRVIQ